MKTPYAASLVGLSVLALVAGCGSYPSEHRRSVGDASGQMEQGVRYGYVDRIDVVSVGSRTSGGGAVLGAVIGGVIGSQIGSGTGRDVATGAGVIGGAVIGNQMERRNRRDDEVYRITVRFDNGQQRQFDYQDIGDLRAGDRVRFEGDRLYRY